MKRNKLIEECMLAANTRRRPTEKQKVPALFRVHEIPAKKTQNLRTFLGGLGLTLGGVEKTHAQRLSSLTWRCCRERNDAHLIQTALLRSMSQAVYQPDNIGHFGLG